jgi:hypothetical protein
MAANVISQSDFLNLDRNHWMMRGLVGWWPMQEGAGLTAFDLSGNGNHGTLTNMDQTTDWVTGPQGGRALDLDNTNDHVLLDGGNLTLDADQPLTLCWWERVTSYPGNNYISRWRLKNDGVVGRAFMCLRSNTALYGNMTWGGSYTYDTSTGRNFKASGVTSESNSVGIWKHFVLVCRAGTNGSSTSDYTLFEDGVPLTTSTASGINQANVGSRFGYDGSHSPSNCQFADVRMYQRALTASNVRDVYLNPWASFQERNQVVVPTITAASIQYIARQIKIQNQRLILK